MSKRKIVILGAGLTGLSAAWYLQRKGMDCIVFEKEKQVGGLCCSKKINGFTFDCGGHLLHFKHSCTFNLVKNFLGSNLVEHQRSAWIYSRGRYTPYPFQANLYGLPSSVIKECLSGINHILKDGRLRAKKNGNFLEWINQAFGRGIARYFMVPYNTKFWTIPPEKMTCEWLNGLIPVPSARQIREGAVKKNRVRFGYNTRFYYPKQGGIASVPEVFASRTKNIFTGFKITGINLRNKEIMTASGTKEKFDYLISTIPLPEMPCLIKGLPKQIQSLFVKLKWNSIFNLNLGVEKKDGIYQHWAYFPQEELSFFRVGFPHNFSSYATPEGRGSFYAEVSYSKDKPIDKSRIILRIKEDLRKVDILGAENQICAEDINDIKYGYPIYDHNYKTARSGVVEFLAKNNIIAAGRYGSWRYMSMEDAILDGKSVAESIKP